MLGLCSTLGLNSILISQMPNMPSITQAPHHLSVEATFLNRDYDFFTFLVRADINTCVFLTFSVTDWNDKKKTNDQNR